MHDMYDSFLQPGKDQARANAIALRSGENEEQFKNLSRGMLLAQDFKRVSKECQDLRLDPTRKQDELIQLLLGEQTVTPSMAWERDHKQQALDKYWEYVRHGENGAMNHETHRLCRNPGIIFSQDNPLIGAAPDALVYAKDTPIRSRLDEFKVKLPCGVPNPLLNCPNGFHLDRIVMVKCPYGVRNTLLRDPVPKYAMGERCNGRWYIKRHHEWFSQLQGELGIMGAFYCDVVIYTTKGIHVHETWVDVDLEDDEDELGWRSYVQSGHSTFYANLMEDMGRCVRDYVFPYLCGNQ